MRCVVMNELTRVAPARKPYFIANSLTFLCCNRSLYNIIAKYEHYKEKG